jgi:transcriptional repressor OPI1
MEQARLPIHSRPLQAHHGEQLTSPPAGSGAAPSPFEPQRRLGPTAMSASPSASIQSPPQFHMQPNILGDPLPLRPSHERTASRSFPDAPTTELPPIQPQRDSISSASNHTLPSLSSVTSGLKPSTEPGPPTHWPSLNPYTTFYTPSYAQPTETPPPRHSGAEMSAASPDRFSERRSGSVSLDDPDVRMAAEALGDLRAGTSCPTLGRALECLLDVGVNAVRRFRVISP